MNKVQKWFILQEYYIIARPVGSSYINFCHGDSTNIAVSEYWYLYRYSYRLFQTDNTHKGFVRMVNNEAGEFV